MRNAFSAIALGLLFTSFAAWFALAADRPPVATTTARATEPDPPTERAVTPGIAVRFDHTDADQTDHRVDRLLALYVDEGESPSALLPPGRFTAAWRGDLNVPLRDRYTFRFVGRGAFTLSVNDQVVLDIDAAGAEPVTVTSEPIWLRQGGNAVRAEYRAPAEGDAQVRLEWSSPDFIFEPPDPTAWTHDPADDALQASQSIREGRLLLAEQRCIRCHAPPADLTDAAMPELTRDAPAIMDVGLRLNQPWLAAFIRDPHAHRPDATMPRPFHGENADEAARDVAAYLATLEFGSLADETPVPNDEASIQQGGHLFASLGCIGCHSLEPPGAIADDRLSLHHVAAKFKGPALRAFLREPSRRYAHNAMPDFDLDDDQATALAAFLLDATPADAPDAADASTGDADRGQHLVAQAGCMNCHALPVASELNAPALAAAIESPDAGCLTDDPAHRGTAPQLALTADDRRHLRRLFDHGLHALTTDHPAEYAHRQLERLNCRACHQLDGQLDRWTLHAAEVADLLAPPENDERELDQSRPPLTWAADKLQTDHIRDLLAGDTDPRPRPWLHARMPGFAVAARTDFAEGLAKSHGLPPGYQPAEPDPDLAAIGRRLVSDRFGFGCTDCHGVGDHPPQNVFDAMGQNFAHAADRLRPAFYDRWMHDPPRYLPHTRMPRYTDSHGYTALADILDGDAHAQFHAIWHYLMTRPNNAP